jgi:chemotaxis protein histidine kinase CheA
MDIEMIAFFIDEGTETLASWEETCLRMEQDLNIEYLDELFRYAHNLKGSAKMVDLAEIGALVHKIEDVINAARNQKIKLTKEIVEFFLDAQTLMSEWVQDLRTTPETVKDVSELEARIYKYLGDEYVPQEDDDDMGFGLPEDEGSLVMVSSEAQVLDVEKDLVISQMHLVMEELTFLEGEAYTLNIKSNSIDTTGIQWLLCLKEDPSFEVNVVCSNEELRSGMRDLGVLEKIL